MGTYNARRDIFLKAADLVTADEYGTSILEAYNRRLLVMLLGVLSIGVPLTNSFARKLEW